MLLAKTYHWLPFAVSKADIISANVPKNRPSGKLRQLLRLRQAEIPAIASTAEKSSPTDLEKAGAAVTQVLLTKRIVIIDISKGQYAQAVKLALHNFVLRSIHLLEDVLQDVFGKYFRRYEKE